MNMHLKSDSYLDSYLLLHLFLGVHYS